MLRRVLSLPPGPDPDPYLDPDTITGDGIIIGTALLILDTLLVVVKYASPLYIKSTVHVR
jgi:hypothetical protein